MINFFKEIDKKHIFYLISISIMAKIAVLYFTIFFARSMIDFFDLRNYILKSLLVINNGIPYISFNYEYPILSLVPMTISTYLSILLGSLTYAFPIFQTLMCLFDIITTICIYLIVLKLYQNKSLALKSGILYATALSPIYTSLTRFDSFPVMIMMVSIFLFIYKENISSYIVSSLAFFTKVFPIIVAPFFIIYEFKNNENWLVEVRDYLLVGGIFSILFLVPFLCIGGLDTLKPYLFATGSGVNYVYANTFNHVISAWTGININLIASILSVILIISIIIIFYTIYQLKKFNSLQLIKYICITLCILITISKFHSAQYFMWITPLLVILVIDDIKKIGLFILFQILTYIEFPLLYGSCYTNVEYTNVSGSFVWWATLLFFTFEYIILFILLYKIYKS